MLSLHLKWHLLAVGNSLDTMFHPFGLSPRSSSGPPCASSHSLPISTEVMLYHLTSCIFPFKVFYFKLLAAEWNLDPASPLSWACLRNNKRSCPLTSVPHTLQLNYGSWSRKVEKYFIHFKEVPEWIFWMKFMHKVNFFLWLPPPLSHKGFPIILILHWEWSCLWCASSLLLWGGMGWNQMSYYLG